MLIKKKKCVKLELLFFLVFFKSTSSFLSFDILSVQVQQNIFCYTTKFSGDYKIFVKMLKNACAGWQLFFFLTCGERVNVFIRHTLTKATVMKLLIVEQ